MRGEKPLINTAWDIEIKMMVPFDVMAKYPDDDIDEYIIEPTFIEILKLLNIKFNPRRVLEILYNQEYEKSAIEVHYSEDSFNEFIILDTYIGKTDQLDFIYMMFRGNEKNGGKLRKLVHKFYIETCPYNVVYEEGNYYIHDTYKIDLTKPFEIDESDLKASISGKKMILHRTEEVFSSFNFEQNDRKKKFSWFRN